MKKYIVPILLVILIFLQLISLARIDQLKNDLNATRNQLSSLASSQSSQLNRIYANINQMLTKQSSMVDSYAYTFGSFDPSQMTLPVTFKVVPKEVTANAKMMLDVSGNRIVMDRNGTTFMATLPVGIFEKYEAIVILSDNNTEKSEKLDVADNLRFRLLPIIYPHFEGQAVMEYTKSSDALSGEYHRSGKISLNVKSVENNKIEKAHLVFEIDGKMVEEVPINTGGLPSDFDKRMTLAAGQSLMLSVVATDSFGLIHQTIVEKIALNDQADRIQDHDGMWMEESIIKHADGTVLFNPLQDKMIP